MTQRAGTTSRALRHDEQRGLLSPSRTARNGHRPYDADERFAAAYRGPGGARFLRDALVAYLDGRP